MRTQTRRAEHNTDGPEIAYFQHLIERNGQPALDAGCGTGRLLIPFLRAGLDVDGCDVSPDMLALCRESAEREGLRPRLYCGARSPGLRSQKRGPTGSASDRRQMAKITRCTAVVATPDWLRPGMEDISHPGTLLPTGTPDSYADFFYDRFNPLTHLVSYAHAPSIHFMCGEKDTHVPPDGAFRFQSALREVYPAAADNVTVHLIPGLSHTDTQDHHHWWPDCLAWLTRASV